MDLSIIIVSYNTKEFVKKCIESIYETVNDVSFEVIIVDNASTDGTKEEAQNLKYPDYTYIQNSKNLGFSKANNIGIKKATGKYILFLNPDIELHSKTLDGMVKFMDEHKDAGAATCKLVTPNGKIDDATHRGFPTPWNSFTHFSGLAKLFGKTKLFGGYNLRYMDFSKTHQIDALAGAFMIVRREAGVEVGWWDEDYFFYGEDIDFCYKLKQKGWKIYYVPELSAFHYKGVSGGIKSISKDITTATSETRIKAQKERFRAMRLFYKKHYEQKYPKFLTSLVYLGISFKEKTS